MKKSVWINWWTVTLLAILTKGMLICILIGLYDRCFFDVWKKGDVTFCRVYPNARGFQSKALAFQKCSNKHLQVHLEQSYQNPVRFFASETLALGVCILIWQLRFLLMIQSTVLKRFHPISSRSRLSRFEKPIVMNLKIRQGKCDLFILVSNISNHMFQDPTSKHILPCLDSFPKLTNGFV